MERNREHDGPARAVGLDGSASKGLSTPRSLRIRPKEMRILPLRSAVQMGSDVSLGSSVTPDRSAIAVDPNVDPFK